MKSPALLDNLSRYEMVLPAQHRGLGATNLQAAIGYAKESFVKDGVPPGILSLWYNIPRTTVYRYAKQWTKLRESAFVETYPSEKVVQAAAAQLETLEELEEGVQLGRAIILRNLQTLENSEQMLTLKELEIVGKITTELNKQLLANKPVDKEEENKDITADDFNEALRALRLAEDKTLKDG